MQFPNGAAWPRLLLLVLTIAGSLVAQHAPASGVRNYRRARVSSEFSTPALAAGDSVAAATAVTSALAAADSADAAALAATTSTVPARELGDLLHMDTNKFSEKQKQLFKKIVERVARVSIAASEQQQQTNNEEAHVSHDVASADNDDDDDDDDDEETVALLPVEEGRDSKIRQTKVKYTPPSQSTGKPGSKQTTSSSTTVKVRQPAGRPTLGPDAVAAAAAGIDKHKYKLMVNTNINRPASSVATKTDNYTEVIFGNITTTSIVDSLQASEQTRDTIANKNKKRPPPTTAAAMAAEATAVAAATGGATDTAETKKEPIATAKPTKYHYYPHNQHIYLLPECAIQQVCNAVYVRLNYTQPLCACPSRYRDPCSASINEDDLHTTKLIGDDNKKAITLAKTCESTTEMRECRSPRDWSLLALQNTRTGKSHYLVICRCPDSFILEGPMAHDQPTYASVPGIRVFGMMCIKPGAGANRKPPQVPKRDGIHQYQQQQQQHVKQNYQQQFQQHQQQQSSGYNAPQPPQPQQQQYQPNYQYLHRATSDRPVPSQSTPRSNSYLPHHVYQQQQQQLSHSNVNQFEYDDVYARNGAGIDAASLDTSSSPAAAASSASSSSGSSTSSVTVPAASAQNSATTYADTAADTAASTLIAAATTAQQAAGETYTAAVQADTTVPTPAAATVDSTDNAEAPTATDSSAENADSSSSSSSNPSDTSSSSEEETDQPQPIAASRKRRGAAVVSAYEAHTNLADDDRLQAKLEAIVDQLLHSTDGAATATARHRQMRTARVASSIIEQARRQK